MNILIAPDSFKETMRAKEVCKSIEVGFKKVFPDANYIKVPMADGGEGTTEALISSTKGSLIEVKVFDPLQRQIIANYGVLGNKKVAIIEMASSSGLELLSQNEKNPMNTTSYGLGQLINHAIENNIKEFIIGIGGSATNDCGIGMLQALGVKFYDKDNKELPLITPKNMNLISDFDDSLLKEKLNGIKIQVACDVSNVLCGKTGASYTFGPQKGADVKMVESLDLLLLNFSKLCKNKYKKDFLFLEGSGAAGGLGYALTTFLNAKLKSGIDIVMETINLEEKIRNADLVITGEGKIDKQTLDGKTLMGIANLARKYDKKVIAIGGCLGNDFNKIYDYGVDVVFDTTIISTDFEKIKKDSKKNLEEIAFNIAKCIKISF